MQGRGNSTLRPGRRAFSEQRLRYKQHPAGSPGFQRGGQPGDATTDHDDVCRHRPAGRFRMQTARQYNRVDHQRTAIPILATVRTAMAPRYPAVTESGLRVPRHTKTATTSAMTSFTAIFTLSG